MENEYKNIDRFDAYLKDVLSVEEKQVFEKEILENISFKNEFENYKILVEGIEESRKQELKDYIKTHKAKQIEGGFRLNSKWFAAAAVIVFFVAVFILFQNKLNPSQNDYYAVENAENKEQKSPAILEENKVIPPPPPELKQGENPIASNGNAVIENRDLAVPMQEAPMVDLEEDQLEYPVEIPSDYYTNIQPSAKIDEGVFLIAATFDVITYREYLKHQKPVANQFANKDLDGKSESSEVLSKEKYKSNSEDKKTIESKAEPISIKLELYDSSVYKFHYLWTNDKKIKLYGVDKNAKFLFLHTLNKYAILINGNGYEISINKNVQPLKKTNLDIYLK